MQLGDTYMSQRVKLSFKKKIIRELKWLREDLSESFDKIPEKYQHVIWFSLILTSYLFIFDEGLRYPEMTIIGSITGSLVGVEIVSLIKRVFGKHPKK